MKVLHIINGLGSGGAERLLCQLLPRFLEKGIKSDVFVLDKTKKFFLEDIRSSGIDVFFSRVDKLYSLLQIFEIRNFIKRKDYDIVHSHLFPTQLWCSIGLSLLKIPLITTEHSTNNRRRNNLFFKFLDSLMYRKYKRIICVSKATEDNLVKWIPRVKFKTIVIHNGINLERFYVAKPYNRNELIHSLKENSKLILMVSRFSKQKDHDTLINSLKLLPKRYHLLLVGEGPRRSFLERFVNKLNLQKRVHFLGVRKDVPRIMKTVDILVQSSYWEGFGLTVVEGMASGLPVIISDVSGLTDIAKHAFVFPKGNSKKLAEIILRLEDSKIYEEQKRKSLLNAKEFDYMKTVDSYINQYKEILHDFSKNTEIVERKMS